MYPLFPSLTHLFCALILDLWYKCIVFSAGIQRARFVLQATLTQATLFRKTDLEHLTLLELSSPLCQTRLVHPCHSHQALLLTNACDQATQNPLGHCLGEDREGSEHHDVRSPDRESFLTPTFCAHPLRL